jgi:hypothetical protein
MPQKKVKPSHHSHDLALTQKVQMEGNSSASLPTALDDRPNENYMEKLGRGP